MLSDDRPNQVRHAFDLVLLNLQQDTGEALLTRDQFAEEIGCFPRNVNTIMGTLEKMGVIRRERRKIEGVRGPDMVVYFVNLHVHGMARWMSARRRLRKPGRPCNSNSFMEGCHDKFPA